MVVQQTEMTVVKCPLMTSVWVCFSDGVLHCGCTVGSNQSDFIGSRAYTWSHIICMLSCHNLPLAFLAQWLPVPGPFSFAGHSSDTNRGWHWYPNKVHHRKLTLGQKYVPLAAAGDQTHDVIIMSLALYYSTSTVVVLVVLLSKHDLDVMITLAQYGNAKHDNWHESFKATALSTMKFQHQQTEINAALAKLCAT